MHGHASMYFVKLGDGACPCMGRRYAGVVSEGTKVEEVVWKRVMVMELSQAFS